MTTTPRTVELRIRRQDSVEHPRSRRWERFSVPYQPRMTVADALLQIEREPVTSDGRAVASVGWEAQCLEERCGACTMLINGRAQLACSTLIDTVAPTGRRITLEPLSKFPLIRDLVVDRCRLFNSYKRAQAWLPVDSDRTSGPAPRQAPEQQQELYSLGQCIDCAACLEACPQFSEPGDFIGAAGLNRLRLFNAHPTGRLGARDRLESVMGPGGVADCGKAQNCVEVCPVGVPLVDSIQVVSRDTTKELIFGWLLK
jgi:succinate dehydrogenase / fumarate reductase iron-sulfur subunit